MKIYVNAGSKNSITYTPDVLTIEANGKEYEYDINGTVEYEEGGLKCLVRGDLEIRDQETEDFRPLTCKEKIDLIILLSNLTESKDITVNVYPMTDKEDEETTNSINNDTIGEGYGRIEFNEGIDVDFQFKSVFVGF